MSKQRFHPPAPCVGCAERSPVRGARADRGLMAVGAALAMSACGGGEDIAAALALPSDGPSRVSVTPALDLSALSRADWADRLVIDHITINVDDVRLLGADPRIPAGGLALLEQSSRVHTPGRPQGALQLSIPSMFIAGDDLAVFLRVAPSEALEGASVEVYARLYASPPQVGSGATLSAPGATQLASTRTQSGAVDPDVDPAREGGAVDPDVDPADEPDRSGAVDPDVDPADKNGRGGAVDPDVDPADSENLSGAVDPDVDPARGDGPEGAVDSNVDPARSDGREGAVDPDVDPARSDGREGAVDPDVDPAEKRSALVVRTSQEAAEHSLPIVLRDDHAADMVMTLGSRTELNIVVGIPVQRWLTPYIVESLERALASRSDDVSSAELSSRHTERASELGLHTHSLGLVEIRRTTDAMSAEGLEEGDGYFLTSSQLIDDHRIR